MVSINTTHIDQYERSGKTHFLDGVFSPSEARDIISDIIDRYIQFCKIQHMRNWESDHSLSTSERDQTILELERQKKELKAVIEKSKAEGCRISLDGMFELKLVK